MERRSIDYTLSHEGVFVVARDHEGGRALLPAAGVCVRAVTELFPKFRYGCTVGMEGTFDLLEAGYRRACDVYDASTAASSLIASIRPSVDASPTLRCVELVSQRWRGSDGPLSVRFGRPAAAFQHPNEAVPRHLYVYLCPRVCVTQSERCRQLVERAMAAIADSGACDYAFVDVADNREAEGWITHLGVGPTEGPRGFAEAVHVQAKHRQLGKVRGVYWGMLFLPAMLGKWDADGSYRALFDRWVLKAKAAGDAAQRRIDAGQGTREDWLAVEDVPYRITYPTANGEACLFCFSQTPLTWTALSKVPDPLSGFGMKHFRGNMPLAAEMHKRLRQSGVLL
jgi:hypothetical protein